MINWTEEWPQIQEAAMKHGVDPYFIAAIRHTENGGPGKEFGVLSENAPSYISQLNIACNTVRNFVINFHGPIFVITNGRLKHTTAFITAFRMHWAPPKVANDPHDLNANWLTNCQTFYDDFVLRNGPPM